MEKRNDGLAVTIARLRGSISDEVLIFAAIFFSALPYVGAIGFSSDDWAFLQIYDSAKSGGAGPILHMGLQTPSPERPLHGLYLSSLFLLFGINPLPQHLVNTGVLALSGAVLFRLLKELKAPRELAFASAILFGFLPQLTTLRLWYATFQIGLSALLLLYCARLELRFARQGGGWRKVLALTCTAGSLALYETTAPLLATAALGAAWIRAQRSTPARWIPPLAMALPNLLLIAGGLAMKRLVTDRLHDSLSLVDQLKANFWMFWDPAFDWRTTAGLNLWAALSVNFWHSFVTEAQSLVRLWETPHRFAIAVIAIAIGFAAFARLKSAAVPVLASRTIFVFLLAGFATFWLGYAIFFLNRMVHFAPASTGNRMATPASFGVAMVLAAAAKLLADAAGERYRRQVFGGLIGGLVVMGSVNASVVGSRWARAWSTENAVLDHAKHDLAALPEGATIILDGVCPYDGPAIVFESPWDWSSAASLKLGKQIEGDIGVPSLQVTDGGLTTQIYDMKNSYAYGDRLFVYRADARRVIPVPDLQAAKAYWPDHLSAAGKCPRGYPAMGVLDW